MSKVSKSDIVDMIYKYTIEGKSFENISQDYNITISQLEDILYPYQMSRGYNIDDNSTGAFQKGKYNGICKGGVYLHKYKDEEGNSLEKRILVTREIIEDFVTNRGIRQEFIDFILNGPPPEEPVEPVKKKVTIKVKSPAKIAAIAAVSVITLNIVSPVSVFEIGTAESSNAVVDFFVELKDNVVDIIKDSIIGKVIDVSKEKIEEKNIEDIMKENEKVIENANRIATDIEPGYFQLDNIDYIGRQEEGKPISECFSINKSISEIKMKNYSSSAHLSNPGIIFIENSVKIGDIDESDILQNGLDIVVNKETNEFNVSKIESGKALEFVPEATIINVKLGKSPSETQYSLCDKEGNEIAIYQNNNWKSVNRETISLGSYVLYFEGNQLKIGNCALKYDNVYYNNSSTEMSINLKSGDMMYNSLYEYDELEKSGDYKSANKVTGCRLNYTSKDNKVLATYLLEDMKYNISKIIE